MAPGFNNMNQNQNQFQNQNNNQNNNNNQQGRGNVKDEHSNMKNMVRVYLKYISTKYICIKVVYSKQRKLLFISVFIFCSKRILFAISVTVYVHSIFIYQHSVLSRNFSCNF